MSVIDDLEAIRKARKVSREVLASHAVVGRSTWLETLQGKKSISLANVERVALALGCTLVVMENSSFIGDGI